jgi:hypothetical protein
MQFSFGPAERHLVILTGRVQWPKHIEDAEDGVAAALKRATDAANAANAAGGRVLITNSDGVFGDEHAALFHATASSSSSGSALPSSAVAHAAPASSPIEIWAFPEGASYGLESAEQLPALVRQLSRRTDADAGSNHADIPRSLFSRDRVFIFVCTHKLRDNRCGIAGTRQFASITAICSRHWSSEICPFRI